MRIDLVIDASSPPVRAEAAPQRQPTLERLMARGEPLAIEAQDLLSCLRALFELPLTQPLPAAALSLLGDDIDPGDADWLRLEPVHLRADRTRLLVVPLPPHDIEPAEAEALRDALAPHLARAGYELVVDRELHWYLRLPRALELRTQPPPTSVSALDEQHLPSGVDGAALRRLVTEAQMLLHASPVNEAREAMGKLAVNGVWPWGNGHLSPLPRARYTRVFSDDSLLRGIARATGAQAAVLPEDADRMAAQCATGDCVLALCSVTAAPLAAIEQHWAAPLARQLGEDRVAEIRLVLIGAARATAARVTRRCLRRWWRRSRPLAHG